MNLSDKIKMNEQLYAVFSALDNAEDFKLLLEDLCTYKEIEQMAQRLECARLLMEGNTYNNITELTEISSATLSRVSRCVQYGSGGYNRVLKNLTSLIPGAFSVSGEENTSVDGKKTDGSEG